MPDTSIEITSVKKPMHFFYVLDKSGSMAGKPITTLNNAMRETVQVLKDVQDENKTSTEFYISVLQFSNGAYWTTTEGTFIDDFFWQDLEAGGGTELAVALKELNKALTRGVNGRLDSKIGNKNPMIIFMSDGEPFPGWEVALAELDKNHWYQHAIKVAFALGDDADETALAKVVGPEGAVIKTNDLQKFKALISVVSATGSRAGVQSSVSSGANNLDAPQTGKSVVQQAIAQMEPDKSANNTVEIPATADSGTVITY